jgi:hypothetical protein
MTLPRLRNEVYRGLAVRSEACCWCGSASVHTDGPHAVQSLHPAGGAARQAARASTTPPALPPLPTTLTPASTSGPASRIPSPSVKPSIVTPVRRRRHLGGRAARALDERDRRRDPAERPSAALPARRRWRWRWWHSLAEQIEKTVAAHHGCLRRQRELPPEVAERSTRSACATSAASVRSVLPGSNNV